MKTLTILVVLLALGFGMSFMAFVKEFERRETISAELDKITLIQAFYENEYNNCRAASKSRP